MYIIYAYVNPEYQPYSTYSSTREHRYCHSALGGGTSCAELYEQLCTIFNTYCYILSLQSFCWPLDVCAFTHRHAYTDIYYTDIHARLHAYIRTLMQTDRHMCSNSPETDALVLASELAMRAVGAQLWRKWCAQWLMRVQVSGVIW